MDIGSIITAVVGSSVFSSIVTFFLAKRKYNAEVENNEIKNLKEIIEETRKHYDAEITTLNKSIEQYRIMHENDFKELMRLKFIVQKVVDEGCKRNPCLKRVRYDEEDLRYLFGETSNDK